MSEKLTAALRALEQAQVELTRVTSLMKRFPEEPPVGTVLRFERDFPVPRRNVYGERPTYEVVTYTYVAYHAPNGRWYTTGRKGWSALTWDAMVELIGSSPCWTAGEWTEVSKAEAS